MLLAAYSVGGTIVALAATFSIVSLLVRLLDHIDRGAGPEDLDGPDPWPGRDPDEPPRGPWDDGGEPGWWPEFERQFAAHVADAARDRRST